MQRHRGRKSAAERERAMISSVPAEPPHDPASPPAHLSEQTKAWWIDIVNRHDIKPRQFRTLQVAATSWDRAEQARQTLSKHGLTFEDDHGMIRARPEVQIERDSSIRFLRAMRELGLDKPEPLDRNGPAIGISWRQMEEIRR
jgi:phage terminase small subunit